MRMTCIVAFTACMTAGCVSSGAKYPDGWSKLLPALGQHCEGLSGTYANAAAAEHTPGIDASSKKYSLVEVSYELAKWVHVTEGLTPDQVNQTAVVRLAVRPDSIEIAALNRDGVIASTSLPLTSERIECKGDRLIVSRPIVSVTLFAGGVGTAGIELFKTADDALAWRWIAREAGVVLVVPVLSRTGGWMLFPAAPDPSENQSVPPA